MSFVAEKYKIRDFNYTFDGATEMAQQWMMMENILFTILMYSRSFIYYSTNVLRQISKLFFFFASFECEKKL